MYKKSLKAELKTLHSIFSKNEERVNQLSRREVVLKKRLSEVLQK
jgi:hypothetical protein